MPYLATAAGAVALEVDGEVGDLSVGKQFDAVWIGPEPRGTLDVVLEHAADPDDALAKVLALAGPSDVRGSGWAEIGCAEHGEAPDGARRAVRNERNPMTRQYSSRNITVLGSLRSGARSG
jgi:cytosine/adenosine deaminase-related metal-dependent hydrolase